MQEANINRYQKISEKIYFWSFWMVNIYIVLSFWIAWNADNDLVDVIKLVFKFISDTYFLYIVPISIKLTGEYAPAILSALKGGSFPLSTQQDPVGEPVEPSATPSPRETPKPVSPETQETGVDYEQFY